VRNVTVELDPRFSVKESQGGAVETEPGRIGSPRDTAPWFYLSEVDGVREVSGAIEPQTVDPPI